MQRALCRAAQRSRSLSSSRRHASTLLVAEHDGTKLSEGTLAAITACAQMKPITLLGLEMRVEPSSFSFLSIQVPSMLAHTKGPLPDAAIWQV